MNFAQMLLATYETPLSERKLRKALDSRFGPKPEPIPSEKPCTVCAEVKPIGEFRAYKKLSNGRTYRRPECIPCEKQKRKATSTTCLRVRTKHQS